MYNENKKGVGVREVIKKKISRGEENILRNNVIQLSLHERVIARSISHSAASLKKKIHFSLLSESLKGKLQE